MPRASKPEPPDPNQAPFITDEDMPPGMLTGQERTVQVLPPPVRHVFVLFAGDPDEPPSPTVAFRTPAAAQAALALHRVAVHARIETVRLYGSVDEWQAVNPYPR